MVRLALFTSQSSVSTVVREAVPAPDVPALGSSSAVTGGNRLPDSTVPTANSMRRALHCAEQGVALDVNEAATLLQARGDDLTALSATAARIRDAGLEAAGRPEVITYSREVLIPLTHLCRDTCHYCTFITVPGRLCRDGQGMFLSPDEVLDIARRGAAMGCKEALFILNDRTEDR
jgi:FO synthase